MAGNILILLLIEIMFNEVFTSYQPQRQRYIQVPSPQYYQLPVAASPGTSLSSYASVPSPAYHSSLTTGFEYSAYPTPKHSSAITEDKTYRSTVPTTELAVPTPNSVPNLKGATLSSPPFDSNILNNLAIALQLLIVSNLLNMPPPEKAEKSSNLLPIPKTADEYGAIRSVDPVSGYIGSLNLPTYTSVSTPPSTQVPEYQPYAEPYEQSINQYLPSATYLGSSNNLGGMLSSLGVPPAKARPGLNLKSPYDTIASVSGTIPASPVDYRKPDFQSPYAAILAADNYKDLFSMDFY